MRLAGFGPSVLAIGALLGVAMPASAAITANALNFNGLTLNGLAANALTLNALTNNAITLSAITSNAIATTGPTLSELNGVAVKGVVLPDQAGP